MGVPHTEEEGTALVVRSGGTNGAHHGAIPTVDVASLAKPEPRRIPYLRWGTLVLALAALFVGVACHTTAWLRELERKRWAEKHPDADVPFELTSHPRPPDPALWGTIQRPYPTGAFWLNAAVEGGDQPVVAYPYALSFSQEGVRVSYSASRPYRSDRAVADIFASDVRLTAAEPILNRSVERFDAFSFTERYLTANGSFEVISVKGSPYVTFEMRGVSPVFSPLATFTTVNGTTVTPFAWELAGTHFKIETVMAQTWLLFASAPLNLSCTDLQLKAAAPFTGTLRLALLPSPEDEATLRTYAGAVATGGSLDFKVHGDAVDIVYNWEQRGSGELLMLALPHHMDIMQLPRPQGTLNGTFRCIKGPMTPLLGQRWTMRDNMSTIGFEAPRPVAGDRVEAIREAIRLDILGVPPIAPDPYGFAKQCARMARLALIADAVNDTATRDNALRIVEDSLAPWLEGENDDALLYDTAWGGVVSTNGLENDHVDYGNGYYNDHHFHFGYFLYAAAVATRYNPQFYRDHQAPLDWIVGDVASGLTPNRHFPVARHKDFFDFHSWASGAYAQGNGKSQESVSEAVNCYYAVHLFALVTNDTELADLGRLLTQMELRGAWTYWQMPKNNSVYPEQFSSNRMAGMVGALDVVATTWFGDRPEYVHGINLMPFTPITEDLIRPGFAAQEWPKLSEIFDREEKPAEQWASFAYLAHAVVDPPAAWDAVQDIVTFDAGNSLANAMYWIATRPQAAGEEPGKGMGASAASSASLAAVASPP